MNKRTINGMPVKEVWEKLSEQFPKEVIKRHPTTKKEYIPVERIEERLNNVIGIENWSFHLLATPQICCFGPNSFESCITSGQLTIFDDEGVAIVRSANGGADLIYANGSDRPTSVANTADSSARDVFKRCAKRFGIAEKENFSNTSGQVEKKELMQVQILEQFKSLTKGNVIVKAIYQNTNVEIVFWKDKWEYLQKNYENYFKIGKKIDSIIFYGLEKLYQGKKQLIFIELAKKGEV